MIGADTSVLVRYLVGTPPAQARRAATLVDGDDEIGVSTVALAECAHVLRTQYEVAQADIVESLIGLVQRVNVRVVDVRADLVVECLVKARALPGRPVPDALIVAASLQADAIPLATFDGQQAARYGIAVRQP